MASQTSMLSAKAQAYLQKLCLDVPHRAVGSPGNRAATDFFAATAAAFGFQVESQEFACLDWAPGEVRLAAGGEAFAASPSPYSLGCRVSAPLVAAATVDALEALDTRGKLLLMHGEIASEPLMPKNFPFYNPAGHKRIIHALEHSGALALITATGRNPQLAAGLYPFPLIEDGDFNIPSVYLTEEEGARLLPYAGSQVELASGAARLPTRACNVIARKVPAAEWKVVLWAHIDSKPGTPGALDNASGITVLLLLAELLQDYAGDLGLEIVALNGEDYYNSAGQVQYLLAYGGYLPQALLGVNLDGAGYRHGRSAYSLYDCPADVDAQAAPGQIRTAFADHPGLVEGPPWYQGDHMLFVFNGRPALAITSEQVLAFMAEIPHTPCDLPELVDGEKLAEIALALRDLVAAVKQQAHCRAKSRQWAC